MAKKDFSGGVIKMAEYVPTLPTENLQQAKSLGYVPYGKKNLWPQYIQGLFQNSPTNSAAVTTISQMIYGDGLSVNYNRLAKVMRSAVNDAKKHGGFYLEICQSGDAAQVQINYLPFASVRRSPREHGVIQSVYYCQDWSKLGQFPIVKIPTFNKATIAQDLRQVLMVDCFLSGEDVYPLPDYIGSVKAIDLEGQISELHLANIINGMFPSVFINLNNSRPQTTEERDEIVAELDNKLRGSTKAGKAVVMFNDSKDTAAEFVIAETTNADKIYEMLGREVVLQILRGHRVTSPRLMGVLESSGLGNSAEEFDKARIQFYKDVIIPFREVIEDGLKPLSDYLGIKIEFKTDFNEFADKQAAYSDGQIGKLIELVGLVKSGAITTEQARVIAEQAMAFDVNIVVEMFPDEEVETPTTALKLSQHEHDLSDEEGATIIERLKGCGEIVDKDVWELVHEEEAGTSEFEATYKPVFLSLDDFANPEERSAWGDKGLYKLRYAYSQNLSVGSRSFCQQMVGLSVSGVVFRYEDINQMSNSGENGQFAPQGESTYNIFDWKGGVYCHHHWKRQIYFRKRAANGAFLPNKGLENDVRVANVPFVPQKGLEGIAPIDTPSRGSLKNP